MADISAGVLRIGNIAVDVRIRETHGISMQLTSYAVESGKSISDHVISDPNEVEIEFEITNSAGGRERAKRVFQDFITLMEKREIVDIITEHATYHNMVFVGFPAEHAAPNLGTLRATARFQQAGIIGAGRTISAGRNEAILAGYPMVEKNVGTVFQTDGTRMTDDVTYRTGCDFIDSGMQSIRENPAKMGKISQTLARYAEGIF